MKKQGNGARKVSRLVLVLAGVGVVVLAAGALWAGGAFSGGPQVDPSRLATVESGDIARSVVATGKIEPLSKVEVKSKASGIVKELLVDYGDRVKTGQTLVELDKEELQARVREAEATLTAARAAEEASRAALERDTIEAEGPDIPYLRSAVERARRLHGEGIVSVSVLEDADKDYQLALNKQAAALRTIAVARAEVSRATAQVAQTRAALERARTDLQNSTILSPMDGIVLSRDVEVGDAVSSILVLGSGSTLVATLGNTSSVYVLGRVDESDIGRVFLGQQARISVEAFKDKTFEGEVTKISPFGVERDNVTTFEVRVSIRNPGGELKANMSANAEVILEEKKGVLLVPETAVIAGKDGGVSVEVPDPGEDNGVRSVDVKLGIRNGIKAEVLEGLAAGDKVVLQ